jgi:excinuclease ABC subunit C
VGVMIVVDGEGLSPKNYRKYNIKYNLSQDKLSNVDDYYMMKEVLSRRLKITEKKEVILPDIIIIDGGRGQFNIVKEILNYKKFNDIVLISVSKGIKRNVGREIIHLKDKNINLPPNDPLLYFIQRIRDEAHRFAITTHRARRGKKALNSVFNDLSGIGPKRKKLLMIHFGSIEKIKIASKQELFSISGIPKSVINTVYDFFHSH